MSLRTLTLRGYRVRRDLRRSQDKLGLLDPLGEAERRGTLLWRIDGDFMRLRRYDQAAARFHEAAELLGGFPKWHGMTVHARMRQATAYQLAGRSEAALQVIEARVEDVSPDAVLPTLPSLMPSILIFWLTLLMRADDIERPDLVARKLIDTYRSNGTESGDAVVPYAFATRGYVALADGDPRRALVLFDEADRHGQAAGGKVWSTLRPEMEAARMRALDAARIEPSLGGRWGLVCERWVTGWYATACGLRVSRGSALVTPVVQAKVEVCVAPPRPRGWGRRGRRGNVVSPGEIGLEFAWARRDITVHHNALQPPNRVQDAHLVGSGRLYGPNPTR